MKKHETHKSRKHLPPYRRFKMGKNRKKKHLTKHHILPLARGGKSDKYNICMVDAHKHELYHQLFTRKDGLPMTPREIINYLMKTFWNNNYPTTQPSKGKGVWC